MENEFVPYELAVRLKALGFDEPCFVYYRASNENKPAYPNHGVIQNSVCGNGITAPTFSQAFRWFREKNFYVSINTYHSVSLDKPFGLSIDYLHESGKWDYFDYRGESDFETYEEAELACLTKLIEIVESKSEQAENTLNLVLNDIKNTPEDVFNNQWESIKKNKNFKSE
jgi:hypothetical protein